MYRWSFLSALAFYWNIDFPAHSFVGVPRSRKLMVADTEVQVLLVILAELASLICLASNRLIKCAHEDAL
jgi:hypothetical protein